jgi:hypothetical protein
MKKYLSVLYLVALLTNATLAAEGDTLWTRIYGGPGDDQANCIIPAGDGGYLLAGSTTSVSTGFKDMYLVKVNAQGDTLWTYAYGGLYDDDANCIIPSGDGSFLLAGSGTPLGNRGYIYLVKVNNQGDTLWTHTYGTGGLSSFWANSITSAGDGGFLLAGNCAGGGEGASLLMKVDSQGDSLWTLYYTAGELFWANSIIPSGDGGFLLAGGGEALMWLMKVNEQGDTVWARTYGSGGANSITSSGSGGFLLAGTAFGDLCVLKVNAQGDSLWKRTYEDGEANSIISTSDGDFLLAGFSSGDMCMIKLNSQGDTLWTRSSGGSGNEEAKSALQMAGGNYLIAGSTDPFSIGDTDIWLVCMEGPSAGIESRPVTIPLCFNFDLHPNPFNHSTVLRYDLPVAGFINLSVCDISGRKVAELVNGMRQTGTHEVTFDGTGLASGVYLCRLQAGGHTEIQKMVLMK